MLTFRTTKQKKNIHDFIPPRHCLGGPAMIRPLITSRWYAQARAAHETDLSKPQRFPLTDDGLVTERVIASGPFNGGPIAPELAAARYRDWEWQRRKD